MRKALSSALAWLLLAGPAASAVELSPARMDGVPLVRLGASLQGALPRLELPPAEQGTLNLFADRLQAVPLGSPSMERAPEVPPSVDRPTALAFAQDLRQRYSDDALKNLSPAQLNAVAAEFFDRVRAAPGISGEVSGTDSPPMALGFPSGTRLDKPSPPAPKRSLYLLSKPLAVSARLGPVARVSHYVFEAAFHIVKAWLLLRTGVHAAAVALEFAWSAAKAPAMISVQSMADLQIRYWWTKLKTLKAIARIPGVERVAVLTGTETHFSKFVAARQENRGLIFVESAEPLTAERTLGFGIPLPIDDPTATRLRLSLEVAGQEHPTSWTPSLKDLLDRKSIPPEVARDWRTRIHDAKKDQSRFRRFFDSSFERDLKVRAVLVAPEGRALSLGVLSQGKSVKKLLGITRVDQALRAVRLASILSPARFADLLVPAAQRGIPLSDTTVERGARRAPGSWAARLWRRLLGRLITAPS
jgi:hypothetical protein